MKRPLLSLAALAVLTSALACGPNPGGNDGGSGGGGGGSGGGAGGGSGGGSGGGTGGCGGTGGAGGGGSGPSNSDGGVATCAAAFAGCTAYTDRTLACDSRVIIFDFTPAPQCLRVKAGQTVTFNGSGTVHPLSQSCGPVSAIGTNVTFTRVVTFTTPGDYGYFCENHGTPGGGAMAGSIRVDP